MPNIEPPAAGLLRLAHKTVLTAGTVVWRVHSSHRAPHAPNPTAQPDELAGGRFDSSGRSYAYLYLADSPVTLSTVLRRRATVARPGMTRSPCLTHDPGGGVAGCGGVDGPLIDLRST